MPGTGGGGRRAREVALNLGAALGVLCIAATVASVVLGVTPLVFRSGSMSPAIDTGSLALARQIPAGDVREGDIITVDGPGGTPVTHRVVSVDMRGDGSARVRLKGDANTVLDPMPYAITETKRVITHVPYLGYAVSWASSTAMVFAAGVLAGVLLAVAFRPGRGTTSNESTAEDTTEDTSRTEEPSNV
ncbi:signal peptidase I [Tomitella cavernea]|uniref:Signal peptidase I n=1 Tax=Tomitella cavernea TaxID=1387982 RepID=A0ABP9C893_9ACTN|nr:signal peptidase I [Tomitella cavernea]